MNDIWVISDTHFNHNNLLTLKDLQGNLVRGHLFSSSKEMDDYMIEKWNSVVKPTDTVYHLGDVFFGDREYFETIWKKLNGEKRLIVGNHDDIRYLSSNNFFSKIGLWRMFPEFGIVMSHVPLHQSSSMYYGSKDSGTLLAEPIQLINIHGHLHQNASPNGSYINVCVEMIDYTPVNIEELRIV